MAGLRKDCVYLGVKGHVVAIDSGTGKELWRTKLKGGDFVTVGHDGTRVYGATKGELYALDAHTGTVVWCNKLKGLGLGLISILTEQGSSSIEAAAKKLQEAQAAAAAT
jgi:glucose dehydrogenase